MTCRITALILLATFSGIICNGARTNPQKPATLKILKIEPTVFFRNEQGGKGLVQGVDLTIENSGGISHTVLKITNSRDHSNIVGTMRIESGTGIYRFFIPEIMTKSSVEFGLVSRGKLITRQTVIWVPRKHWEICLVPISHHDLGYTNPIERVLKLYDTIYDDVLRYCEETDQYPDEARFRYTVEQSWSLQHYIQTIDPATREKLAKYIGTGRIEVPALYGNMISDLCSHEEMIRLVYPSFRINNEFGGQIRTGSITDVPGISWGLPTVLAGVGAKYFFAGMPDYFEWWKNKFPGLHDFWDEKNILRTHGKPDAFYWEGPDGSKVLLYFQGSYGCWNPKTYDQILKELPAMLDDMDKRGNPFSVVRYGGYGCSDNTGTSKLVSDLVRKWNSRWAYPRLSVSTNTMFFEKLEKQCSSIRTFRADLPQTDYSVGAISSARETAVNRIAHERLLSAEKLAALSNLLLNTNYPDDDLRDAWNNTMLFDEHTWGMWDPVGEMQDWAWNEKSGYAFKAAGIATMILSGRRGYTGGGPKTLANAVAFKTEGRHIAVFNSLSCSRNDLVTVPNFNPSEPFIVVDTETGNTVPHQLVEIDNPLSPVPFASGRYARGHFTTTDWFSKEPANFSLVFTAENVPPLGYKTFEIVKSEKTIVEKSDLLINGYTIENRFYKITLDPDNGTINEIYDKDLGTNLVDKSAPHRFNQLIARWPGTGEQQSPKVAVIKTGQKGPVYASLIVFSSAEGCPEVTQEIILYNNIKRIDLNNRILKDMKPAMEVYFAFPFSIDNPEFSFEGPLSVIRPLKDQFPGSNSNYYSVQHWAHLSDGKTGITFSPVDAHLLEFGSLNTSSVSQAHHGVTPLTFNTPFVTEFKKGYLYSYVINSNFCTNFQTTQLGDILFRYSFTSGNENKDHQAPGVFGWSAGNPLIPVAVTGKGGGNLPLTMNFCRIDQPNVIVLAFKKAEEGEGYIIRLNETEGRETGVEVNFPAFSLEKVFETNLVETNRQTLEFRDHAFSTTLKPFGIKTFRLIFTKKYGK